MSTENPYAAPTVVSPAAAPISDAEAVRKQYLNHEASVKSIGSLYILGAIFILLAAVILIVMGISRLLSQQPSAGEAIFALALGCFYLALGALQVATAVGLHKLQTWAKYVAVVLSAIGLLGFPIGTLISAYFLYLLLSKKGQMVFSEEYKQVIAATPHMKYKTPVILWVLLLVLVLLLVFGIAAVLIAS